MTLDRNEAVRVLAEKVMGWQLTDDHMTIGRAAMGAARPVLFAVHSGGYGIARPLPANGRWNPFADLNAAAELMDKMSETTKETWNIFFCSTGAQVTFAYEGGRERPWLIGEHEAMAESLAEAVALVALKAVGSEAEGS